MAKEKLRLVLILSLVALIIFSVGVLAPGAGEVECWTYNSLATCSAQESAGCTWNSAYSFCERLMCFNGDGTNQTYCETTLKAKNLSCVWTAGSSLCDPAGGVFFGMACSDFNNNSVGCYDTFFCAWNSSANTCSPPPGGFQQQAGAFNNPSCLVITDRKICEGIQDCTWDTGYSQCNGNTPGMQCSNLNKTMCPTFTLLSTCCSWNGSNCSISYEPSCYNNMPPFPAGAMFCEDVNAFKNQALCVQIAGNPWFMPCSWNNVTNECHFNSGAFGSVVGGGGLGEVASQSSCEAQGGIWRTEQYTDSSGTTRTDTWCEFKFGFDFGGGGNCDSSCWACETSVSAAKGNTTTQARNYCENSTLGYCEFVSSSTAPNGLGWCNPKNDFVAGGAKSCDEECAACEFLKNPRSQCGNSTKGCNWVGDTNAPNGVGYCYGRSEKYCGTDCFSCYDSFTCTNTGKGGNGACTWGAGNYCKPSGYNGEVCFDGIDNDNDGKIDCADADCSTDKFCGGNDLGGGAGSYFGDCPSFTSSGNATCTANGCTWLKDTFEETFGGASAGHCDFPGSQCYKYDGYPYDCNAEPGCSWENTTGGTCSENDTLTATCFTYQNEVACKAVAGCGWFTPVGGASGHCDLISFAQCRSNQTRFTSQTTCEMNESVGGVSTQICAWSTAFNPLGECEPVCFSRTTATCLAGTNKLCSVQSGICEPKSFSGKCYAADGNQTKCEKELNASCSWFADLKANNGNTTGSGWCKSKGDAQVFNFLGDIPPIILGDEGLDPINDSWDIREVGLRDDFNNLVLGTTIQNFNMSATCNSTPLMDGTIGGGHWNYTFFWYLDSDGNSTNRCAARDNSSLMGFEFSFKYQAKFSSATLTETKAAYQCVNDSWGAVPIPLFFGSQKMCGLIGGGMAGIDKKEMYKIKTHYNKSKDLRLYATVSSSVINDSAVNDSAGPFYYTHGSFDFRFEDCSDPGVDNDGDGMTASNDPDCVGFLKFGFVPNEVGFQCGDQIDNDGDNKIDCVDESCKYDAFYCGGQFVADPNDKTTPKVTWLKVDTFPDSAFVMYDTNEPANGTVEFYNNDTTCSKAINKTIRDIGLVDTYIPDYKTWHDGPIDTFGFNTEAIDAPLRNSTTFFYKTRVCDVSGNCAVSACLNFTTKTTTADCKSCSSTFNFPFAPPTGAAATAPLGNIKFKFEMAGGGTSSVEANAASGSQLNYSSAKSFNLTLNNPNVTKASNWTFKLVDASVSGKVAVSSQNFTGGTDIQFNSTVNGSFVGMSTNKCQELINTFRPKKLEIGIPGNFTTALWQCAGGTLSNCTNKASNASGGAGRYVSGTNMSLWLVPAEWGC